MDRRRQPSGNRDSQSGRRQGGPAIGSALAENIDTLVANGRSLRAGWVDIGPLPDLEVFLRIDLSDADELARFKRLLASVLPTILVETPFDPQRARRGASRAGKADASQPAKKRRSGRTRSAADTAQAPAAQPAPAPAAAAAHPVDSSAWTQLFEKGEYEALVDLIRGESLSDVSDSSESVSDASDSSEPGRGSSGRVLADLERWIDGWLAWRDRSIQIAAGSTAAASSLAGRSFAEIVEEEKDVAHGLLPFFYRCEQLQGVDKPLPTVEPDFRPLNIICLLRVMGGEYFDAFVERAAEQAQVAYDSLRHNIKNKADRSAAHLLTFEPIIQLFENVNGSGLPLWLHVQNGDDVKLRVKRSIVDGVERAVQELRDRFGCAEGSLSVFIKDRGAQVEAMYQLFKTDRFPRTFFATGHFLFSFSEISFVGHHVDGPKPWLVEEMEKEGRADFLTDAGMAMSYLVHNAPYPKKRGGWSHLDPVKYDRGMDKDRLVEYVVEGSAIRQREIGTRFRFYGGNIGRDKLRAEILKHRCKDLDLPRDRRPLEAVEKPFRKRFWSARERPAEGGVPDNWWSCYTPRQADALRRWIGATPDDKLVLCACDPGENSPVTIFNSVYNEHAIGGRSEGFASVAANNFRAITKTGQRRMSAFNVAFNNEFSTKFSASTVSERAAVYALRKTNQVGYAIRRLTKVRAKAMYRRVANELADFILGGELQKGVSVDSDTKVVLAIGHGFKAKRRSEGAGMTLPLLRELDDVLSRRRVEHRFVVVNEAHTSQRCSNPDCVDDEGRRSRVKHATLGSGSTTRKLLHCETCDCMYGRDAAAAANIAANLASLLQTSRAKW